jgi:hypothetical protein
VLSENVAITTYKITDTKCRTFKNTLTNICNTHIHNTSMQTHTWNRSGRERFLLSQPAGFKWRAVWCRRQVWPSFYHGVCVCACVCVYDFVSSLPQEH